MELKDLVSFMAGQIESLIEERSDLVNQVRTLRHELAIEKDNNLSRKEA